MQQASIDTQFLARANTKWSDEALALKERLARTPEDAKLWFQLAQVLPEQRLMREAVAALSRAIAIDPGCGIYYRWRGHRYLNVGAIEEACADFATAARLLPENWDSWYHYGLACVVLERFGAARYVYNMCWKTRLPEDLLIPLVNWSWINLGHLGRHEEAAAVLEKVHSEMDPGPNVAYLRMVRLYKGELTPQQMMDTLQQDQGMDRSFNLITQAFGLASYYRINGDPVKYEETLDEIIAAGPDGAWNAFGHGAAVYRKRLLTARN